MAEPTPEEQIRQDQEQLERSYQRVFESEDGKAVLEDLRKSCSIDTSTYVPGCTDAMLVNEGCRRVFLRIVAMTRMDTTKAYLAREGRKPVPQA